MRILHRGAVLLIAAGLAGCSVPKGPDEFAVVNKAPLTVPPEFELRPPTPGEPRPQEIQPATQAIQSIFPGRTELPPPASNLEDDVLSALDIRANPAARSEAGDNTLEPKVFQKGRMLAALLAAEERQFTPDNVRLERGRSRRLTVR